MDQYLNREEAGRVLAGELRDYANRDDVIVLALPRGGVPVAYQIAKALHLPLDVYIVRKLGVPGHSELAMGAIAMGNVTVLNHHIMMELKISPEEIFAVTQKEEIELKRRELAYRGPVEFPSLKNKTVIVVDDGIATGASIRAAVTSLKHLNPDRIVVAVPVAAQETCKTIRPLVDKFICPLQPSQFYTVGAWYQDFEQTEDAEVTKLLNEAKQFAT